MTSIVREPEYNLSLAVENRTGDTDHWKVLF